MKPAVAASLELANRVRLERVRLRRELEAGRLTLLEVLESPAVARARAGVVLAWAPGVGPYFAARILRAAGVGAGERLVGDLTPRQRVELDAGAKRHYRRPRTLAEAAGDALDPAPRPRR